MTRANDVHASGHALQESDRQLLHAALLSGDRGLTAWNAWQQGRELRRLESPRFHLLPSIYLNLKHHGEALAQRQQLAAIHRHTWSKTQVALRRARAAMRTLDAAGIPNLMIKGMPMVVFVRQQLGARLMGDVDLLVREEHAIRAVHRLTAAGWRPRKPMPHPELLPFVHAVDLRGPNGQQIDLHWRPFAVDTPEPANEALWRTAREGRLADGRCRYPSACDLILLTCIHARKSDRASRLRWLADLHSLLSAEAPLDWALLFERAETGDMHFVLADCLLEYAALDTEGLPDEALDWARRQFSVPPPKYSLRFRDPWARQDRLSGIEDLPGVIDRRVALYRRICGQRQRAPRPHEFIQHILRYYQWEWNLDRRRQLLSSALQRVNRALRANLTREPVDN